MDACLRPLRFRHARQDDGWMLSRRCEEHEVRVKHARLRAAHCFGPEIGQSFGVGAVDDDVDVRVGHMLLPAMPVPRSLPLELMSAWDSMNSSPVRWSSRGFAGHRSVPARTMVRSSALVGGALRGWVSYMRRATTRPDRQVSAA